MTPRAMPGLIGAATLHRPFSPVREPQDSEFLAVLEPDVLLTLASPNLDRTLLAKIFRAVRSLRHRGCAEVGSSGSTRGIDATLIILTPCVLINGKRWSCTIFTDTTLAGWETPRSVLRGSVVSNATHNAYRRRIRRSKVHGELLCARVRSTAH